MLRNSLYTKHLNVCCAVDEMTENCVKYILRNIT